MSYPDGDPPRPRRVIDVDTLVDYAGLLLIVPLIVLITWLLLNPTQLSLGLTDRRSDEVLTAALFDVLILLIVTGMILRLWRLLASLIWKALIVNILFKEEIDASPDPAALRTRLAEEYRQKFNNPYHAASAGYVDDVIEPRETRAKIIAALAALRDKYAPAPPRKHGNIPV
jgi:hypothetical protein